MVLNYFNIWTRDQLKQFEVLAQFYQLPDYLINHYRKKPSLEYEFDEKKFEYKSIFDEKHLLLNFDYSQSEDFDHLERIEYMEDRSHEYTEFKYELNKGYFDYEYKDIKITLNNKIKTFEDLIESQTFKIQPYSKNIFFLYKKISSFDFKETDLEKTKYLKKFSYQDFLKLPDYYYFEDDLPLKRLFRKYQDETRPKRYEKFRNRPRSKYWSDDELFQYDLDYKKNEEAYKIHLNKYEKEKKKFDFNKQKDVEGLKFTKNEYEKGDVTGIYLYSKLICNLSPFPEQIKPKNFKFEYNKDEKILILSCDLPDFNRINIFKPKSKVYSNLSKTEFKKISEDSLYIIPLRIIFELFYFDYKDKFKNIAFNGIIETHNKSTGQLEKNIVSSLFVEKSEVLKLNLLNVDPKECFRSLKGISATKITDAVPIKPILTFSNDPRVVENKDILDNLKDENLAVMDWDEFEHLIRELFAKEFANEGSEVKVTQASRDRGVDAIAYDPDPIRGGKFIIQAKRYTATVDVSAVRDLYGTIMNEGANRGILVTTAKFGSDAYDFAKDKNITLLEGNQLLGLLSKHGYNFKIDINEARKILNLTPKKTY